MIRRKSPRGGDPRAVSKKRKNVPNSHSIASGRFERPLWDSHLDILNERSWADSRPMRSVLLSPLSTFVVHQFVEQL
jgi:hypothetical protein